MTYLIKEDKKPKKNFRISRSEFETNDKLYHQLLQINIDLVEDRSDNMHMIIQNMSKNHLDYYKNEQNALEVYKTFCNHFGSMPNSTFDPKYQGYVQEGNENSLLDVNADKLCKKIEDFSESSKVKESIDDALEKFSNF